MRLTKSNYYSAEANKKYAGYSQLKSFARCEARFVAELNGEYGSDSSTALLVGSYVDAWLDGGTALATLQEEHPEMFKRDGSLKSDFLIAEEIIDKIKNDKVLYDLLKNGKRQKIMTGKIGGVDFKIKIDCLHDDKIVDGKVMRDTSDIWDSELCQYLPWWKYWGYDWQAAIYQTIVLQNTGKLLPFIDGVVTKEKGHDVVSVLFTNETINNAFQEILAILPRFVDVKSGKEKPVGCGHCEYCRSIKRLEPNVYVEV